VKENSEGDDGIETLLAAQKFTRCPRCGNGVEKNTGCDHMTCRCGLNFSYVIEMEKNAKPAVPYKGNVRNTDCMAM
jgi:hypothetical protein